MPRPQHIAFVNVAGHGHVYPSLAVVAELTARGHRVSYVTTEEFTGAVEKAGARALRYGSEIADSDVPAIIEGADAETRMHLLYLAENLALLEAAEDQLGDDPPDLVVYDVFPFIAGRLLAARWRRPAVRLYPILAANEHYSIFDAIWETAGYRHPAELDDFRAKMTEVLAMYGIRQPIRRFWDAIEDFNVVFVPRAFQVAADTFDDRFAFVGPSFTRDRLAERWDPPAGGAPVALVSLGTTHNRRSEFFRECAAAFAGTPWHVVMSVGRELDPASLGPLPPNVEVHQWISHLAVLEHARVCVTHGATGTLMEALYHGCPLIVAPHSAEAEPTARRVPELGLGYALEPGEVTAESVAALVRKLDGDDATRARVRAMRAEIREAGGGARAADEITAYLERVSAG
ncbi:macrolide family glycosyltransferase [Amycolatopsis sp. NPDC005003]